MKNLVYINNGLSSVFDSQVLTLLKYYSKEKVFERIILCFGYKSQNDINWLLSKDTTDFEIFFFKSYPNYPFFNYLLQLGLLNSLKKLSVEISDCFFHVRGEMLSYHIKCIARLLKINNYQLLTDVRGVSVEEVKEFSTINEFLKSIKIVNYKKALRSLQSDRNISVVSESLKSYLYEKYSINNANIVVNSCIVSSSFKFSSEKRVLIRKELCITENEILIVFTTAGSANWQRNDMIIEVAEKGFKVLNLSKLIISHKNIINKFLPYNEMPDYLSASDIAFIWRDESVVNKVSAPVKFSEYIACGLPVIHNGTVDLINQLASDLSCGFLIKNIDELSNEVIMDIVSNTNRDKLSEKGEALFGLEQSKKGYSKIYDHGHGLQKMDNG
jgi:hypothetical protein